MFAKHPLDLSKDKLDERSLAEAIRLAIIAELDAVSFYLQVASRSPDPDVKKVFEDVAAEEKTHFGEFLALLRKYDPEQAEKLQEGFREVKELTGLEGVDVSASGIVDFLKEEARKAEKIMEEAARVADQRLRSVASVEAVFVNEAERLRLLRRHLPVTLIGPGVDYVAAPVVSYSGSAVGVESEAVVPLREVAVEFLVPDRLVERARRLGEPAYEAVVAQAARRLVAAEEKLITESLLSTEGALEATMGSWERPGEAVDDVARAIARLEAEGVTGPYVLLVSPQRYAKLLTVHEKTGVMELARLEKLAKVLRHPLLPTEKALLLPADRTVFDIVVGVDTRVDHIGPEAGSQRYRAWETLALRVRYPRGITVLSQP
jgi:uncharacterized linocin/CFP29 family protein/rubrerythrin